MEIVRGELGSSLRLIPYHTLFRVRADLQKHDIEKENVGGSIYFGSKT